MFIKKSTHNERVKALEKEIEDLRLQNEKIHQALNYQKGFVLTPEEVKHGQRLIQISEFTKNLVILKKLDEEKYGVFQLASDGTYGTFFRVGMSEWLEKSAFLEHINKYYVKGV